jgi:hypothetical protein
MDLDLRTETRRAHIPIIAGPHHLCVTVGKNFGERFSLGVSGINVANRRVLLDNSFTFGCTHYMNPREIFVQLRYLFIIEGCPRPAQHCIAKMPFPSWGKC